MLTAGASSPMSSTGSILGRASSRWSVMFTFGAGRQKEAEGLLTNRSSSLLLPVGCISSRLDELWSLVSGVNGGISSSGELQPRGPGVVGCGVGRAEEESNPVAWPVASSGSRGWTDAETAGGEQDGRKAGALGSRLVTEDPDPEGVADG